MWPLNRIEHDFLNNAVFRRFYYFQLLFNLILIFVNPIGPHWMGWIWPKISLPIYWVGFAQEKRSLGRLGRVSLDKHNPKVTFTSCRCESVKVPLLGDSTLRQNRGREAKVAI